MQWVETTGKSIEEATEAALAELGIAESDAEVVIVAEPKPGLFGRVRSEARVRARVRPTGPPAKDGRRRSRGGGASSNGGDRRRSRSGTASAQKIGSADAGARPEGPNEEEAVNEVDDEPEVALEEQGEVAVTFVEGVLSGFGLDGQVRSEVVDEDTVRVAVDGEGMGVLIGTKGRTLDALQDLTRTAVFRETGARHGYVVVDVSDYRAKRRVALERFTVGVAEEVRESGESKSLEPMSPADRKLVHDTVNGIDGVTTSSQGEEPRRYVVIRPD
jgi:spoIIIJ-associated protein